MLKAPKDDIELPVTRLPAPFPGGPERWSEGRKSRKEAEEKAFNSRKQHWLDNLEFLSRMEKLLEKYQSRFTKKNINNMVDLLKRLGLAENVLVLVVLGFYGLRPKHRAAFELLFDDSHLQRDRLQAQIRNYESQIRQMGNEKNDSFFEWEARAESMASLRDQLKIAKANLGVLPKKNSIPPDLWKYHSETTLKKLKRITKTPRGHDLTPVWTQLWKDSEGMKRFIVPDEEPDEELLLNIWRRTKTIFRGNHPIEKVKDVFKPQGVLSGLFKRRKNA